MPRSQYDLLVKLLGSHIDREAFRPEFERVRTLAQDWLSGLRVIRKECLRQRARGWSEHEQVLYLALRRGLLLGEAQVRWLDEVEEYLNSGRLPDVGAANAGS